MKLPARIVVAIAACGLAGCSGIQSSLTPAGRQAEQIAELFWWMTAGAAIIWAGVVALALYYARPHEAAPDQRRDRLLIIGGGVVFPIVTLTLLLAYGMTLIPPLVARAPEGSLLVDVVGEQWWWRVRYERPGQEPIELANEIRIPVGEPVQFRLSSDNVIHSFWVPALGGKMDMIPGRITYLALTPTSTGVFAGACAEYCGESHAFMRFYVEVMEKEAFADWLAHQATPAAAPTTDRAARGQQVLLANGCGACHRVRGTAAGGVIGPDLTHLASRMSLAAATLPNDQPALKRWVTWAERVKPGVHMPAFGMLPDEALDALAAYLGELR